MDVYVIIKVNFMEVFLGSTIPLSGKVGDLCLPWMAGSFGGAMRPDRHPWCGDLQKKIHLKPWLFDPPNFQTSNSDSEEVRHSVTMFYERDLPKYAKMILEARFGHRKQTRDIAVT